MKLSVPDPSFDNWPTSLPVPYGPYRAVLLYVHDGDTVTVRTSVGFDSYMLVHCRIESINAPELPTPAGKASRDYLAALLPPGTQLKLTTTVDQTMSFTRYVGKLQMADGRDVGEVMLAAGMAVPMKG